MGLEVKGIPNLGPSSKEGKEPNANKAVVSLNIPGINICPERNFNA